MAKNIKKSDQEETIAELTADLQRVRADFENYRKRTDSEKLQAKESGFVQAVYRLLPVIDNIERSIKYIPEELKDNTWANGVVGLVKQLEKSLNELEIERIDAAEGATFNPDLHEAIQFDDSTNGETEVIQEELQPGYMYKGVPIRHALVKVTKK